MKEDYTNYTPPPPPPPWDQRLCVKCTEYIVPNCPFDRRRAVDGILPKRINGRSSDNEEELEMANH